MKTLEGNKRINSTDVVDDGELIEVNSRSEYAPDHGDGNGEEKNCDDCRVISSGNDAGGFGNINDDSDGGNNGGKENIGYSDIGDDAGGFGNINDDGDGGNNGGKENIGYSDIGDDAGGFGNINDDVDEGNNGGKENIGYSDIGEKDDSLVVEDNDVFGETVCADGVEMIDDCGATNITDCAGEETNAIAVEKNLNDYNGKE
ncbi:uncharacterized PPE family protein PPE12-like [Ruditapes philippinarum]|uniref:uncharacterized PPE family protein PPE12-like n=1 Tax=Ruditapes philippinarum TaxID=129788 RepID=UPI00295AB801|nr:uncharacterized PPE family protein PPE12-like [Ruditapes philippinarum]